MQRPKERPEIRAEFADAFRCSPDLGAMVLNVMEGFYPPNEDEYENEVLSSLSLAYMALLEELRRAKIEIGGEVKERARKLVIEWKRKIRKDEWKGKESVARYREAMELCREFVPLNKMSDVIHKLIIKGKQLLAVKFIFLFELADKFQPVPLLLDYVNDANNKKLSQKVPKSRNNSHQLLVFGCILI
ncbi:unnamed protein product [Ilex paraguariensis]|uniref:FRIGIDA-like protein n=1 Tax=Ilex paraguariensis TaxID=185542 RepID=A0ABC8RV43_9AQUA